MSKPASHACLLRFGQRLRCSSGLFPGSRHLLLPAWPEIERNLEGYWLKDARINQSDFLLISAEWRAW